VRPRLLRPEAGRRHGALHRAAERVFEALLAGYRRTLDVALRHHAVTFAVFLLTVAATGVAFLGIPKGFFPPQDTGLIIGQALAAPDASFREMSGQMRAFAEIVQHDPGVATVAMSAGAATGQTTDQGQMFITLKPRSERDASAFRIIERLRPQLARVEGAVLLLQPAQDVTVGGRATAAQYQYTLQDVDAAELEALYAAALSATPC
jgi:HAE1 family hydrophobic/amphiphilic exporter-1